VNGDSMLMRFFPLGDVARVMRALTLQDVFAETAPGYFAHTSGSATMGIPGIDALVGHW